MVVEEKKQSKPKKNKKSKEDANGMYNHIYTLMDFTIFVKFKDHTCISRTFLVLDFHEIVWSLHIQYTCLKRT